MALEAAYRQQPERRGFNSHCEKEEPVNWMKSVLAAIERVKNAEGSFTFDDLKGELPTILEETGTVSESPERRLSDRVRELVRAGRVQETERRHYRVASQVASPAEDRLRSLEERVKRLETAVPWLK